MVRATVAILLARVPVLAIGLRYAIHGWLRGRIAGGGLGAGALCTLALAPLGFWWPSNVALAGIHLLLLRLTYSTTTLGIVRTRLGRGTDPR
jgi:hypothetical protein